MQGIAKKTCDVLSMITRFHGVVVDVPDLDSAVADYARLLGQDPGPVEADLAQQTRSVSFPVRNMLLEIREDSCADAKSAVGLAGIRLDCDEVEEIKSRLSETGSSLLPSESRKVDAAGEAEQRAWLSTFVDPDGSRSIPVELISEEVGERPTWADPSMPASEGRSLESGSVIDALDHVVIMSGDIEATRDFYRDGLGIRLALDRSFEKRGVRLIFFRIGGVTIEIGGRLEPAPAPGSADRFGGLAWQVGDMDAIHSRLSADRFDVSEIRDGHKPGTRVCTVRDPVHDVPTLLIEPVS